MSVFSMGYLFDWKKLREKCTREGCSATTLRHPLAGRGTGILLGRDWYCGGNCFGHAVKERVRRLIHGADRTPPRKTNRSPLGLLLLSRGRITHAQLQFALQRQRETGVALAETLCEMELVSEQDVAEAAATQWGCPVFKPKSKVSEVQARVPCALMRTFSMAPVHYTHRTNRLLVGFVREIEHQALLAIERITSCAVAPCFITASDCWQNIHVRAGQNHDVSFERISSPAEVAAIVQSYAFQIGAEDARLEICGHYLWARLNCEGVPTDLTFSLGPDLPRGAEM